MLRTIRPRLRPTSFPPCTVGFVEPHFKLFRTIISDEMVRCFLCYVHKMRNVVLYLLDCFSVLFPVRCVDMFPTQ